jgi:hypothetical protein
LPTLAWFKEKYVCLAGHCRIDKRIHREIQKAADKAMAISYYANIDRLCYKAMVCFAPAVYKHACKMLRCRMG